MYTYTNIYICKTLNETAKGNLKNTLIHHLERLTYHYIYVYIYIADVMSNSTNINFTCMTETY